MCYCVSIVKLVFFGETFAMNNDNDIMFWDVERATQDICHSFFVRYDNWEKFGTNQVTPLEKQP